MHLWSDILTDDDIYDIANELCVCIADRGGVNRHRTPINRTGVTTRSARSFVLRPEDAKDEDGNRRYQRLSASPFGNSRRVFAVCWHGHRDFMQAIFERDPNARIKSYVADYKGLEDFQDKHPETAYRNVGSQMYPQEMDAVCTC